MSLLNVANDGLPNVLLAVYRYLLAEGRTPEAKVVAVCAPDVVCNPNRLRHTLNTWAKLGLLDRDGEWVRLAPHLPPAIRDKQAGERALRRTLRELVLRAENNDPFWGQEGVQAADFTRGVAWGLAMDPAALSGQGYQPVEQLELRTLPDHEVFRNDVRWNGFKAWAPFLGFGWLARFPKAGTLVLDPTPAVREELAAVFGDDAELNQREFLDRLRGRLPVLDGGTYRTQVEGALKPGTWTPPPAGGLSASLSVALLRLRNEGRLLFDDRADAAAGRAILTGSAGRTLAAFTHVRMAEGRA